MFTPAQVMSAYSLLKSPISLESYVNDAIQKGYSQLVLSEYETLSSAVQFYQLCQANKVKPIIALQCHIEEQAVVAIALNTNGYLQLVKLSSWLLNKEPILDKLTQLSDVAFVLVDKMTASSIDVVLQYIDKKQVYLAVTKESISAVQLLNEQYRLPLLANAQVRYLNPSDYASLKLVEAIADNSQLSKDVLLQTGADYLMLAKDFKGYFPQDIVLQTQQFYDAITVHIPLQQQLLPKFSDHASDLLKQQAYAGLQQRGLADQAIYIERLEKELAIINQMGFADYFLIVWDLMAFAHKEKIMTGAGRGSSAASLVSYCLNITNVDPIKYDLLFERFLNAERYTMPDIDLDFPDNKRNLMLQYAVDKYGKANVAQIATFGTFAAKQAIRDVARVFGATSEQLKKIASAMTQTDKNVLDAIYQSSSRFRRFIDETPDMRLIYDLAKKIEGLPRHVSTHAAGVVISDRALDTIVPIQQADDTIALTQFVMQDVEAVGLLKMDFLGLKNLAILADAQKFVASIQPDFDVWQIDWQDTATLELFCQADTDGIFQFESAGIRQVLKRIQPHSLNELAAVNALYRPGPMEQINHFAARKMQQEAVVYPHEDLTTILQETYGIVVYQEQVMQIASTMAGFSLGQADILRRAIGKKKKADIDAQRTIFVQGAIAKGYTHDVATTVYDYIEKFANYGFPKSHAFAYSMLAYQLAYIKVHYPQAFYLALMRHTHAKSDQFKLYARSAHYKKIKLLAPDINRSYMYDTLEQKSIRFGLHAIQGLRNDFRQAIIEHRQQDGAYTDLYQLMARLPLRFCKEEHFSILILSGALDSFGQTRASLIASLPAFIKHRQWQADASLFASIAPAYTIEPEYEASYLQEQEEKIVGYVFADSVFEPYHILYEKGEVQYTNQLLEQTNATLLGVIRRVKIIQTKTHQRMAFVELEDEVGKLDITLFPETYRHYLGLLEKGNVVAVTGQLEKNKRIEGSFIVQRMQTAEQLLQMYMDKQKICYLKLIDADVLEAVLHTIKQVKGSTPVAIYFAQTGEYKKLSAQYTIDVKQVMASELVSLLGKENIVVKDL